jgi:hypothetical protein
MLELFGDLPGVLIYFDDFLVTGETKEELEFNLRRVLVRCREKNLKLQLKNCQFFVQSLPWLGHVIGNGSLKPYPEKVEASVKIPAPTDKNGLVRFLGMVTYLEKFCKDLAVVSRPLRDMLTRNKNKPRVPSSPPFPLCWFYVRLIFPNRWWSSLMLRPSALSQCYCKMASRWLFRLHHRLRLKNFTVK